MLAATCREVPSCTTRTYRISVFMPSGDCTTTDMARSHVVEPSAWLRSTARAGLRWLRGRMPIIRITVVKTLYAYMPCSGLRGVGFIDDVVRDHYGGSHSNLLRHFCRAKENKWCPPWIARNYEAYNPDDVTNFDDCVQEPDAADEDAERRGTDVSEQPVFPNAEMFQQHFVFDDEPEEESEAREEEAARQRSAATAPEWKPENREPWQLHSELGPNVGAAGKEVPDFGMPELVNPRDHDWTSPLWSEFSHRSAQEFWEKLRSADDQYSDDTLEKDTLNDDDQLLFVNLVLDHAKHVVECVTRGAQPTSRRILLLGTAGSGKTRATQTALQELQRYLTSVGLSDAVDPATFFRVAAPSGSAAFNIRFGASTVHNLINWFTIRRFTPVTDESKLFELQEKFRRTFMVFFDECSMIGRQMMGRIDSRLRQAKHVDATMGGVSVIAVGDPGQCEAICDQQLYDTRVHPATAEGTEAAALSNVGLDIWQHFDDVIVLTAVHRLRTIESPTNDAEREYNSMALRWVECLRRVRNAELTLEDYFWLCERKRSKLSFAERAEFDAAPVIMDFRRTTETNVENNCDFYNAKHLRYHAKKQSVPVVRFKATHIGIDEEEAEKLEEHRFAQAPAMLETAKGARMLLTRNLALRKGLINGTRVEVVDVLYAPGTHPNHAFHAARMPACIVCNVPHYQGPSYFNCEEHPERATWLPFLPKSTRDEHDSSVTRSQFPLMLAWALTPQKAQGMTLDKAIVNTKQVTHPGVLFVSLSRVRHYMDLMLEDDFPALSHILKLRYAAGHSLRLAWEKKMMARFGQTARRHRRNASVYAAERCWTAEESALADRILPWLRNRSGVFQQGALADTLYVCGFLDDNEDIDEGLLDRVCAKLVLHPHCHELDAAVASNSATYDSPASVAPRRVSLREWIVPVEDLRVAREAGDLSAAAFELCAQSCRTHLPFHARLANPFACQADRLKQDFQLHHGATLCYPFRTSTSHVWSCYVVRRAADGAGRVSCLRPPHVADAAFHSTDAMFQRIFDATSVDVVDAVMSSSQDVLLLSRLLRFLIEEGLVPALPVPADDVVFSRYATFLDRTLACVADGTTTVEAVFNAHSDARDAFERLFVSNTLELPAARKRSVRPMDAAPSLKLPRVDLPPPEPVLPNLAISSATTKAAAREGRVHALRRHCPASVESSSPARVFCVCGFVRRATSGVYRCITCVCIGRGR